MADLRSFQHGDDNKLVIEYLLGSTSEEETERLDELSVADDEFAARLRSAENDLVDAYARGELDGETLHRFKSFYLASPNRLEKVRFAEVLQTRASESSVAATKPAALGHRTPPSAGTRTLIWSLAGLAALLLLAAGYLVRENRRLQNDFFQEQARRIQLEQQKQAPAAGTPAKVLPTPQLLAFVLSPQTRGIAAITAIALPPGVDRVAFRLILETDDFDRYQVKLKNLPLNQIVWRSGALKTDSSEASRAVFVVVPGNVFNQQNYSLELTGMPTAGAGEFVGTYAFKVFRK